MAGKGILLDENGDLLISGKSLQIGKSEMQEVGLILSMNQGEQKFLPVLGPNLIQLQKSKSSKFDIEQRVRVHLAKDGKDYAQIKEKIILNKL